MSAAGEIFEDLERYQGGVTLQNERRRRKYCGFRAVLRGISPCKMSAAGENFAVSERYLGRFYLRKLAPQAKFLGPKHEL